MPKKSIYYLDPIRAVTEEDKKNFLRLNSLLNRYKATAEDYLEVGELFLGTKNIEPNFQTAFAAFKRARDKEMDNAMACFNLGVCFLRGIGTPKDPRLGFSFLKQASKKDSSLAVVWKELSFCYEKGMGIEANEEEANNCYEKFEEIVEADPNQDRMATIQNIKLVELLPTEKDEENLENGDVDPDLSEQAGEGDEAEVKKASPHKRRKKEKPKNARNYVRRIDKLETVAELLPLVEHFLQSKNGNRPSYYNRQRALSACQKAIKLEPGNAQVWYTYGIYHLKTKDPTEALRYFNHALKLDNTLVLAYVEKGKCMSASTYAEEKERAECYLKAVELDQNCAVAWAGLGFCYRQQQEHRQAFECFKKATALELQQAEVWYLLGEYYEQEGNKDLREKAFQCYQKANEIDKTHLLARAALAACYQHGIGVEPDKEKAKEYLKTEGSGDNEDILLPIEQKGLLETLEEQSRLYQLKIKSLENAVRLKREALAIQRKLNAGWDLEEKLCSQSVQVVASEVKLR